MRLTVPRIRDAYDKLKWAPVAGVFTAGVREIEGRKTFLACPVCAVMRVERLGRVGRNSEAGYKSVEYAARKLGVSYNYLKSFMTAYDGRRYDVYQADDPQGVADGERARLEIPPILQR